MTTQPTKIETKRYEFAEGTLVKHFRLFSSDTILVHYTVIKDGKTSKNYRRIGDAFNFLNKKEVA